MNRLSKIFWVLLLFTIISRPAITMAQVSSTKDTNTAVSSAKGEVSAVQSRVRSLDCSSTTWNNRAIGIVLVGAMVGMAIVGLQVKAYFVSNSLKLANDDLIAAKDRLLKAELQAKDEAISEANEKAATATKLGGDAMVRAGTLEVAAASLKSQNLAIEKKLETERSTRLELEKSLAPRVIRGNADVLKPYAGVNVIIESSPDAEPRKLANSIALTLDTFSGWTITSISVVSGLGPGFDTGVSVETISGSKELLSTEAGQTLIVFLNETGIQALDFFTSITPDIPPNTVKVRVGLNPMSYFEPEVRKKMFETFIARSKSDLEFTKRRRQLLESRDKEGEK